MKQANAMKQVERMENFYNPKTGELLISVADVDPISDEEILLGYTSVQIPTGTEKTILKSNESLTLYALDNDKVVAKNIQKGKLLTADDVVNNLKATGWKNEDSYIQSITHYYVVTDKSGDVLGIFKNVDEHEALVDFYLKSQTPTSKRKGFRAFEIREK